MSRTPLALFMERWKDCRQCDLADNRTKMVFGRGSVPCDVALIGEGPGRSEDVWGQAFVGPAGHLADDIIAQAYGTAHRTCFMNLVCCLPPEDEKGKVIRPPKYAIEACERRLIEFVGLCDPKVIVRVGKVPQKNVPNVVLVGRIVCDIEHPSYILQGIVPALQGLAIKRAVVTIRNAVWEMEQKQAEKRNASHP